MINTGPTAMPVATLGFRIGTLEGSSIEAQNITTMTLAMATADTGGGNLLGMDGKAGLPNLVAIATTENAAGAVLGIIREATLLTMAIIGKADIVPALVDPITRSRWMIFRAT